MTTDTESRLPVEELAEEFAARIRRGDDPSVEEYTEKYPQLADEIRAAFGALLIMEKAAAHNRDTPVGLRRENIPRTTQPKQLGEFRIVREIGRGGMGVVYEAIQETLGREVALKVLAVSAMHDETGRQRFFREARAAAKLHHTNIVPVFAVGEQNELPYFAMQYIRGLGLHDLIGGMQQRQAGSDSSTFKGAQGESEITSHIVEDVLSGAFALGKVDKENAPGEREMQADSRCTAGINTSGAIGNRNANFFRTVAQMGVQAAEALAYAHQHGLLHRDIKPSNLMLDSSGVVWVMDFGLAKTVSEESPASLGRKAGENPAQDLTQTGDVVGTLRYLAPERFQGQTDARSDIYSLGLTLYELLALQPAFDETDRNQLLLQLMHKEPTSLRSLNSAVPRDLETIVHHCLYKEPERRYTSAQMLADDLRRFVQGEPIRARRVPYYERIWRWCRRNPMAAAFVTSIFLLVFGVCGAAVWYANDRAERIAERAAVERDKAKRIGAIEQKMALALQDAETLQKDARNSTDLPNVWESNLRAAADAVKRAEEVLHAAPGPVNPVLVKKLAKLKAQIAADDADRLLVDRLVRIRSEAASPSSTPTGRANLSEKSYQDTFARANFVPLQMSVEVGTDWLLKERPAVRETLLVALHDWWRLCRNKTVHNWLGQVLDSVDDDLWRREVRYARIRVDRGALQRLAKTVKISDQLPVSLSMLALGLDAVGLHDSSIRLWRRAQAEYPNDFLLNMQLGYALYKTAPAESATFYRVAHALRPKDAYAIGGLGAAVVDAGRREEGIALLNKAVKIAPKYYLGHFNLGHALNEKGDSAGAATAYRAAIAAAPKFAAAYHNLALVLKARGDLPGAIRVRKQAVSAVPDSARVHYEFGVDLQKHGDLPGAMAAYKNSIARNEDYAKAHINLGTLLHAEGDLEGSIAAYRKAIAIDPKQGNAHGNLGRSLRDRGDLEEAVAEYRLAAKCLPEDGAAHGRLGGILLKVGAFEEARQAFQQSVKLLPANHPVRKYAAIQLGQIDKLIQIDKRLLAVTGGKAKARDTGELLMLANFCLRQKAWFAASARLYKQAFDGPSPPAGIRLAAYQHQAARAAAWASIGRGRDSANLKVPERAELRDQALDHLRAELNYLEEQLQRKKIASDGIVNIVSPWQTDYFFAGIRDGRHLEKLSDDLQSSGRNLWADVAALLKRARSRFRETNLNGYLLTDRPEKSHSLKMKAGASYQIYMKSAMFDPLLRLEDSQGKALREDDDSGLGRDARIVFRCKKDGAYRIIAASWQNRGVGLYTIRVREFPRGDMSEAIAE